MSKFLLSVLVSVSFLSISASAMESDEDFEEDLPPPTLYSLGCQLWKAYNKKHPHLSVVEDGDTTAQNL